MGVASSSPAHLRAPASCKSLDGCFWLFSAFNAKHRDTAILTTIFFAGGLVTGRVVSFIVDGQPAPLLILYAAMEFALVPIAYWIYTSPD